MFDKCARHWEFHEVLAGLCMACALDVLSIVQRMCVWLATLCRSCLGQEGGSRADHLLVDSFPGETPSSTTAIALSFGLILTVASVA